jgi:hypothetical protein
MSLDGLDKISAEGLALLRKDGPVEAHSDCESWIAKVSQWLTSQFPDSGLAAEWGALGTSQLVMGRGYHDNPFSWSIFQSMVQSRLRWLGSLPGKVRINNFLNPARIQNAAQEAGRKEIKLNATARAYVDPSRINDLKTINQPQFDISRLVRLCEEINICFAGECYLALTMLVRSVLDHVPPLFSAKSFTEVANNYKGSGGSFRLSMLNLENSSRKIADSYLHGQIRSAETLPNAIQTDFSNDFDVLLAEIGRILKSAVK